MTESKMIRIADAMEMLGVGRTTILYWIKRGYLSGVYKAGPAKNSPYVIPLSQIEAILEQRKPPAQPND